MEEVVEYDEEGNKTIVEKRKLLIPELKFETLDLRDEATERQFLQTLRQMGVPISDERLMVGVDFDIEDEAEQYNEELMKTIAQQEAKMKTYKISRANLPIPPDLKAEVEGGGEGAAAPPGGGALPSMPSGGMGAGAPPGMGGPSGGPGGAIIMPPPPGSLGPGGQGGAVPGGGPPPATPGPAGGQGGGATAPGISMERRPGLSSSQHTGNQSSESIDNSNSDVTVDTGPMKERTERSDSTLHSLPKAKKKSRYTLVEPDDESEST
jgi:hypothetical protein